MILIINMLLWCQDPKRLLHQHINCIYLLRLEPCKFQEIYPFTFLPFVHSSSVEGPRTFSRCIRRSKSNKPPPVIFLNPATLRLKKDRILLSILEAIAEQTGAKQESQTIAAPRKLWPKSAVVHNCVISV